MEKVSERIVNWLTPKLISFIEEHELVFLIIILVLLLFVGFGIYAIYMLLRTALGYHKDKAEIAKTRMANIKELHAAQDAHNNNAELYNLHLSQLVLALRNNESDESIDSYREEAIHHYCHEYLDSLGKYLDYYEIYYESDRRRQFVHDVIIKELNTAASFVSVINSSELAKKLGRKNLPLSQKSYGRIWSFWRECLAPWSICLRIKLYKEKKKWS